MPAQEIDVILPVYNAAPLVQRCIESIYEWIEPRMRALVVQDDASGEETARLLDALACKFPRLLVHHAPQNQGYGGSVNQAVERAKAPYVLVLNSDTEAHHDFASPLLDRLRSGSHLAAVSPAGNTFRRYDLKHYQRRDGCVVSYSLWGYAFLIRRELFQKSGGFDPRYRPGYFEDLDFSRRLTQRGFWFGIVPESQLDHVGHASFRERGSELLERNARLYYERFPEALRRILLISMGGMDTWSGDLIESLDALLRAGGRALWMSRNPEAALLPAIQVSGRELSVVRGALRLLRARQKPHERFTELWIANGTPASRTLPLLGLARGLGLETRIW